MRVVIVALALVAAAACTKSRYHSTVNAVAVYPDDGNAGLQLTLALKPYGVRFRYMAETGFEVFGAFQLELPTAITWSR